MVQTAVAPCPVCGEPGGFHDTDNKAGKHAQVVVSRELLKEPGWAKEAYEKLKAERAKKEAEIQAMVDAAAAELDDDKQAWGLILDDAGEPTGEMVLVKGTRVISREMVSITDE